MYVLQTPLLRLYGFENVKSVVKEAAVLVWPLRCIQKPGYRAP
jgi:hypothetical protein